MSNVDEARARIAALEADPRHGRAHDPERADRETRDDPIDPRPRPNKPEDPRWKLTEEGFWDHPDHRHSED